MIIYLCALAWYVSGVLSFVFWWTRDYDLTSREIFVLIMVGFAGPIAFLFGACNHKPFVIIKQRK